MLLARDAVSWEDDADEEERSKMYFALVYVC
eukprot:COSAG01_NODE_34446_length_547_cov_1.484375_2_plen_30_part_01